MKVVVWNHPGSLRMDVYVLDHQGRVGELSEYGRVERWRDVPEGADPGKASFCLDRPIFEAFVREAGKVTQASDATVEALADARAVRDRLLVLVERAWER